VRALRRPPGRAAADRPTVLREPALPRRSPSSTLWSSTTSRRG
jgi:hypothetical protein